MNHLQKFEAFLIPKPVRKFMPFWSDEDIKRYIDELTQKYGKWVKVLFDGYNYFFIGKIDLIRYFIRFNNLN